MVLKENQALRVNLVRLGFRDLPEREDQGVRLVLMGTLACLVYLVPRVPKVIQDSLPVRPHQGTRETEDGRVHRAQRVFQVPRVQKGILGLQDCQEIRVCQDYQASPGQQVTLAGRDWLDQKVTQVLKVSVVSSALQVKQVQ